MEAGRRMQTSLLMSVFIAGLLSQHLVVPVVSTSLEDQKNYYPPDPHHGGSHNSPPHGSGGHRTPSHGGGYTPKPPTPSGGNCGNPPHAPSTPSPSHGGGSYHAPPTYGGVTPPTPVTVTPPTPIIDPGTPSIPTPPFFPAPNLPIGGTCDFWRSHPTLIWGVLGWFGTVGNAFGITGIPGFGANMSLQQALSNTRNDGFGSLVREATASFLNSMVNTRFPFTTKQVRENFVGALHSDSSAAAQAHRFRLANEGHFKP